VDFKLGHYLKGWDTANPNQDRPGGPNLTIHSG
jgi:hypothetical protein